MKEMAMKLNISKSKLIALIMELGPSNLAKLSEKQLKRKIYNEGKKRGFGA